LEENQANIFFKSDNTFSKQKVLKLHRSFTFRGAYGDDDDD